MGGFIDKRVGNPAQREDADQLDDVEIAFLLSTPRQHMDRQVDRPEEAPETGSPEAGMQPAVRDMARNSDDPEIVGRTHARLIIAARKARRADREREKD